MVLYWPGFLLVEKLFKALKNERSDPSRGGGASVGGWFLPDDYSEL
jgi:hypothetical protein